MRQTDSGSTGHARTPNASNRDLATTNAPFLGGAEKPSAICPTHRDQGSTYLSEHAYNERNPRDDRSTSVDAANGLQAGNVSTVAPTTTTTTSRAKTFPSRTEVHSRLMIKINSGSLREV
jgi:hypothetical protein